MKTKKTKRKICFVITSFIHYSRNMLVLEALRAHPGVDTHVIIAGTALSGKYSAHGAYVRDALHKSGFRNLYEAHFNLEGGMPIVKAKTAGLGTVEFSSLYSHIQPDLVVVRGDRFEVLSAAVAASLMNIPIAHIEGGDITGTIDESIRHAITKLAHIHFATNEDAKRRIVAMGENAKYVFNFGSPDIEVVMRMGKGKPDQGFLASTGSGAAIDVSQPYMMVSYHPVTSELDSLRERTHTLLRAVCASGIPAFWFWPNFDAGAEEHIAKELRMFNDEVKGHRIRFMRYLPPHHYLALLNNTACLVGNSSAGIKECSYLGVPVVNVGSRQAKRLKGRHVRDVEHDTDAIAAAIQKQIAKGRYTPSRMYAKPDTGKKIAGILATIPLYLQKQFVD